MKQQTLLALVIAGAITGCGGSSGQSTNAQSTTNATPQTVAATSIAQGVVTGFGSVVVNGTHYDVSAAPITLDGDSAVESDIEVGQIVTITATGEADKTGHVKATKVAGETQVRGLVTSVDLTAGTLVVLDQTITFTADTFFRDGVTSADLKEGVFVFISSKTNADGSITATRIDIKKPFEAKKPPLLAGIVADLDTTALTFTLHGLTVDYSKATVTDLGEQTLANGLLVRAEGSLVDKIFVATALKASVLDLKHHHDVKPHTGTSIGGQVADLVANTSFTLGTTTVLFSETTEIKGGVLADVIAGANVRVIGTLDADKNLVAKAIILFKDAKSDDQGLVQAVDVVNNTITVNGIVFDLSSDTSVNDRSKFDVRLFDINDIQVGDLVNIRGFNIEGKKHLNATRLERCDRDNGGATSSAASSASTTSAAASSEAISSEAATSSAASSSTAAASPLLKALNKTQVTGEVEAVVDTTVTVAGHEVTVDETTLVTGFESAADFLKNAKDVNVVIQGVVENDKFKAVSVQKLGPRKGANSSVRSSISFSSFAFSAGSLPARSSAAFSSKSATSEIAHSAESRASKSAISLPAHSQAAFSSKSATSEVAHSAESRASRSATSLPTLPEHPTRPESSSAASSSSAAAL